MKKILKVLLIIIITPILFIVFLAGVAEVYKQTQGNFHEVDKNKLYRSAQLDEEQFKRYITQEKIQTIINLRGSSNEAWYKDELAVSREYNVTHVDFPMTAFKVYDLNTTRALVTLFETLPKPILVHCHGGADRSALASALWRYAIKGESKENAQKAFNHWYGYLPYLMWEKKKNLEFSFEAYVKAD